MIAKIKCGHSFAGLVEYANNIKEKSAKIIDSDGIDISSNRSMTANLSLQAKRRPNLHNPVGHISLSFATDDASKLTDELMAEIARKYLRRMGIVDTQYMMVRHYDTAHPHLHIVYNRVNNGGETIKGDQNFKKSASITKELTEQYHLTFGKDKRKVDRSRLKGKDAVKYKIYDAVTYSIKQCHSMQELKSVLKLKGIDMDFKLDEDNLITKGIIFTSDEISFAGSKIDRSLSYDNLVQSIEDTIHSVAESAMEIVMQPHIAPTAGGGGSSESGGWNEKDKEREREYNPYRRRR